MEIWVFAEDEAHLTELIAGARRLADGAGGSVACLVATPEVQADPQTLISLGADKVLLLPARGEGVPLEAYANLLHRELQGADLFLFGSTRRVREIAARLAAELGVDCVTEAKSLVLAADGTGWETERMIYGGLATARARQSGRPVLVGTARGTFAPAIATDRKGSVVQLEGPVASQVTIQNHHPRPQSSANLKEAPLVVSFGRGVQQESQIAIIRELAEALDAELACSRPIADDYKWLPEERYVGVTGQVIKPDLYVLVGCSGQVQHMAGVRDAGTIVAINSDPNAPVFEAADYGLVGDLKVLVPALAQALRTHLAS